MTAITKLVAPSGHQFRFGVPDSTGAVTLSIAPIDPLPNGVSGNWKLAFSDEFTEAAVNTAKWNLNGFKNNGMNQGSSASNAAIVNGSLQLQTPGPGGGGQACSVEAPYGLGDYVEFRAWFSGYNWPAVWCSGPYWPSGGEIDVMEWLGRPSYNYHWGDTPADAQQAGPFYPTGVWANSWHTYGAWRQDGEVQYYWDGVLVGSTKTSDNGEPQNVIMTCGPGNSVKYGSGGALLVDYVRVWSPA